MTRFLICEHKGQRPEREAKVYHITDIEDNHELHLFENDELVDSELGMIPEGWEISDIKDVVNKVVLGGTPARKNEKFWNGEIP